MRFRNRLIISYALVILVCLGIIGIVVSVLLQTYRDRVTMIQLDDIGKPIYVQIRNMVQADTSVERIWAGMQEQADKNNVYILLMDKQNNIMRQLSPESEGEPQKIDIPAGQFPQSPVKEGQGQFETADGQTFLYSAHSLGRLFATGRQAAISTLMLAIPRGQTLAIMVSLVRPFLYAGIIALAVSIIIALFLAHSISRPVQKVTRAAERIAQGQYDQEIEVAGPKEIQGLAESFNKMSQQVKQAQERLRHFVADVSHQLKSPLTSIQGFAQAITDGTAGDKNTRLKAAGIIQDESKKICYAFPL